LNDHQFLDAVAVAMITPGMVRGADFADETHLAEESAGIGTITQGFPLVSKDDHETVEKASFF
jgi:hypothetical protein